MDKELLEISNGVYGLLLLFLALGLGLHFSSYLEFRKGATEGKYNDWWIILILPLTPILVVGSMLGATQFYLKKMDKEILLSMIVGIGS